MKNYIYLVAVILLAMGPGTTLARAAGTSAEVIIPSSFGLSGAARATDNCSNAISLDPGSVEIVRAGSVLYLLVPALAGEGTRLASLEDRESGALFRNNTMLLPIRGGGGTGTLVATTDNLTAGPDGYSGAITGLELDVTGIAIDRDGAGFTAGATILLKALPRGAKYRISFVENAPLLAEAAADLEAAGLAPAAASPVVEVWGSSQAAADAAGFVVATVEADASWSAHYGEENVAFYYSGGGRTYRLPFRALGTGDRGVAYQAIAPGAGQFAVVATTPLEKKVQAARSGGAGAGDAAIAIGVLAVLLIALGLAVRRALKR